MSRAAFTTFLDEAFVAPLRAGRLDPRGWPPGLRTLAVGSGVVYALVGLVVVFAGVFRDADRLVYSPEARLVAPLAGTGLVTGVAVLSLALGLTAALHAAWYLRVAALLVAALTSASFVLTLADGTRLMALGAFLGLVFVFALRGRGSFAWWEFPLVATLVGLGTLVPMLLGSAQGELYGFDARPAVAVGALQSVNILAVPALVAGGASVAHLVVGASEAGATALRRDLGRRGLVGLALGLGAVRAVDLGVQTATGGLPAAPDLVASGVHVLAAGLLGVVVLRVIGRRGPVVSLAGDWSAWIWPLSAALLWGSLALMPLLFVQSVAESLGFAPLADALRWARLWSHSSLATVVIRTVVAGAAVAWAWRMAARGRPGLGVLLGTFAAGLLVNLLSVLRVLPSGGSVAAVVVVVTVVALTVFAGVWLTGRLDATRATGLVLVLGLTGLYAHRGAIAQPLDVVLGFAPMAVLLAGLVWRVLVDGDFANGDSPALPRASRVLLHLGNSLFAVALLAFTALTRASGGALDVAPFAARGDEWLGTPLLLGVAVVALVGLPKRQSRPDQVTRAAPSPPTARPPAASPRR